MPRISPSTSLSPPAAVLADATPEITPPESVRSTGMPPWSAQLDEHELLTAIQDFTDAEAERPGTSVVIGPPGLPGVMTPAAAKGLEFDAVLVVYPERILAEGFRGAADLYVALTRATQRLGVLHRDELPPALSGLTPV